MKVWNSYRQLERDLMPKRHARRVAHGAKSFKFLAIDLT